MYVKTLNYLNTEIDFPIYQYLYCNTVLYEEHINKI
jgi:hypothetical protein